MSKLTKRFVESITPRSKGHVVWDDELPCFGLRVYPSGKRSYLLQYRAKGRSRRYTIGIHGIWTPETARREAKALLGQIAQGEDPATERAEERRAVTVKQLCEQYIADMEAGLILGKGGRPKKPKTIETDIGRIRRHIIPLLGTRRIKDITKPDMNNLMKDIIAGKTRVVMKTEKLRGKAIVTGGPGTAIRTMGLLGGIFTYAIDAGIIDQNPTHGLKKPRYKVRDRRLSEAEYRTLGRLLKDMQHDSHYGIHAEILRLIALTGCRRGEIINLRWSEVDIEGSCLRLRDSKEGASVRPVGLPVIDYLEAARLKREGTYVFPGQGEDNAVGNFPQSWKKLFADTPLWDVTPHVLRHSFASIANDLGFTEITIAALIGHAKGSVTSKYVHTLDSTLIMAADTVSGYVKALLEGVEFRRNTYTLDRQTRRNAIHQVLTEARPAG
ncbi:integrase arm-type DNA-binding domain-containing protein [Roseobacter sp. HKCCD9010]|uniref:tyrosine-type recombinase/integrase n=1 Tax=unclassified Roseobacter TaxID=196798 RepID=UPI001491A619|nr:MULTISPECIES: site-specific integrase [unclassified Roseobacter]MBF9050270.1 integrase arm-type DNA-binding domain-containing protein [Rhodobacterales bacterium HKCCD4356]NNV12513.1 integrase arm-type DNA-binding domain-containing protein [Roseobacter sp. HKCCD7357]NNV16022.1 integrase arm-type DNA-binding domain-containing protein [Roseobacter sp. HKCCD8768]NNV25482.1 integrase arm-type DNA-binding domain-containing protein [Roseobacter sp. HKCCD8192]NNV29739.1 integrase arm-type DNA-bindi